MKHSTLFILFFALLLCESLKADSFRIKEKTLTRSESAGIKGEILTESESAEEAFIRLHDLAGIGLREKNGSFFHLPVDRDVVSQSYQCRQSAALSLIAKAGTEFEDAKRKFNALKEKKEKTIEDLQDARVVCLKIAKARALESYASKHMNAWDEKPGSLWGALGALNEWQGTVLEKNCEDILETETAKGGGSKINTLSALLDTYVENRAGDFKKAVHLTAEILKAHPETKVSPK